MNEKNIRLVTAESVRAGHPDKFCDQVADAILDAHLRQDLNARVAVEVFATAGKMIIGGEVTSKAAVDCGRIVADAIDRIGYTMCDLCEDSHDPLELEIRIHDQSPDISAAVGAANLGAGDQGIVVLSTSACFWVRLSESPYSKGRARAKSGSSFGSRTAGMWRLPYKAAVLFATENDAISRNSNNNKHPASETGDLERVGC